MPRMGKVTSRMKTQNGSAQGGTDGAAILSQMDGGLFPAWEGRGVILVHLKGGTPNLHRTGLKKGQGQENGRNDEERVTR